MIRKSRNRVLQVALVGFSVLASHSLAWAGKISRAPLLTVVNDDPSDSMNTYRFDLVTENGDLRSLEYIWLEPQGQVHETKVFSLEMINEMVVLSHVHRENVPMFGVVDADYVRMAGNKLNDRNGGDLALHLIRDFRNDQDNRYNEFRMKLFRQTDGTWALSTLDGKVVRKLMFRMKQFGGLLLGRLRLGSVGIKKVEIVE